MSIFKSKLKLAKGTRFTSTLFITVSLLIAAGVLWGANMYYDIDTGKIMVEQIQEVTQSLRAIGGLVVQQGASIAGGLTVDQATTTATSTVQGTFIVDGNMIFGSDAADTAIFNADIASDLIPSQDIAFYLGTSTARWRNLYVATATIGDTIIIDGERIEATGTLSIVSGSSHALNLTAGAASTWTLTGLTIRSTGDITATSTGDIAFWLGDTGGTEKFYIKDSGGAALITLDSNGNLTISGNATTTGTFGVEGVTTLATTTVQYTLYPTYVGAFTLVGNITGNDQQILDLDKLTVNTIDNPSAEPNELLIDTNLTISGSATTTKLVITTDGLLIQAGGIDVTGGIEMNSGNITGLSSATGTTITIQTTGGNLILDASTGQITAWGNTIYADSFQSTGTDATLRKSGDQIVREVVPIFGFDLPAQTASTSYVTVSRTLENYPFPEQASGTTRVHKFVFRYSASTSASLDWRVATTTGVTYSSSTLPVPGSNDLNKGDAYLATTTIPTDGTDWWLDIKTPDVSSIVRIFQIFLIAYDQVN